MVLQVHLHAAEHLLVEHAGAARHLLDEGHCNVRPWWQLKDLHDRPTGKLPHLISYLTCMYTVNSSQHHFHLSHFFAFLDTSRGRQCSVQASPILDAFEVFGCDSDSISLPPFPYPVFGPSMLWEEEKGRLMVCGGSSWRQVIAISITVVNVISISVNMIMIIITKIIIDIVI